jgi:hypothetical protein
MHEVVRNLLLLALAAAFLTVVGSGAIWWMDEERRIRRFLHKALGAHPEAVIVAPGRGRAAGISTSHGLVAILWDGGVKGLIYRMEQLVGAEMILDDQVAARVHRGESRRALDQSPGAAHRVALRLVFDNPRDPDFELELWPAADAHKRDRMTVAQAIAACRRWISGVEAILRQSGPPPSPAQPAEVAARPPPPPLELTPPDSDEPPWDEDEGED